MEEKLGGKKINNNNKKNALSEKFGQLKDSIILVLQSRADCKNTFIKK